MSDGNQRLPMTGKTAAQRRREAALAEEARRKAERDAALAQALEKLR